MTDGANLEQEQARQDEQQAGPGALGDIPVLVGLRAGWLGKKGQFERTEA
jgi:hypothetical protein